MASGYSPVIMPPREPPTPAEIWRRFRLVGQGSASQPDKTAMQSGASETPSRLGGNLPQQAPILLPSDLPPHVKLPPDMWENIYQILHEKIPEWFDVKVFPSVYAARTKKMISNQVLKTVCGVASFKELFSVIPWLVTEETIDGTMRVRLAATKKRRPLASLLDKNLRHGRRPGGRQAIKEWEQKVEDDWISFVIPEQPSCLMPQGSKSFIPLGFRTRLYELLYNWFPNGVDIGTFCEAYMIRYGGPLMTHQECNMSLAMSLRAMADIIDVGKSSTDGRTWIRPVPYECVRQLVTDLQWEKAEEEESLQFPELFEGLSNGEAAGGGNGENDAAATESGTNAGGGDETVQMIDEAEERRKMEERRTAEEVISEVTCLIAPAVDAGVPLETLAILYASKYPERGIGRADHEQLREWMMEMPDVVKVYPVTKKGRVVYYAKSAKAPDL